MNKFFKDSTGEFSLTRFWTFICYSTCTYIMIKNVDKLDWTMLMAYAGVVGASDLAKKWINKNATK